MRKILAILALALVAIPAQAQSRFVADSAQSVLFRDGVATYSDNNGLVATSWFTFRDRHRDETAQVLMQVHCATGLIRYIREIVSVAGQPTAMNQENWQARWENPIPDTLSSRFQVVCWSR